ncbi:LOW QUALITY PROTEIN: autophagy-related protein 18f-like [Primulina tabacum]|uniref:LOW QUALITY PROTEIN: autophagy-related protein 18f-like n=1 Tax=Primulina tabacum TaxID=48773 RepID=UPI003F591813
MRNDIQRSGGDGGAIAPRQGKGNNGIIPNSFKAISSYLRIVSSGASTVASTVRSAATAASAVVERDIETNTEQVSWAGFDKIEFERGVTRKVLLLGYSYGFQVWDVEVADNVHSLVSRNDGSVSFMQMVPKPVAAKQSVDKFAESRPLLIICAEGSFSGGNSVQEGSVTPFNGAVHGQLNDSSVATVVWFYSLRSQSYVHLLRFRSVVHLVRCSSRVVAVLQWSQIHCFDAATLEREYTILTNPVVTGSCGAGNIGLGPLAVGPRWMAYSGGPVAISESGRVSPQQLAPSATFPNSASNGSVVAHYAKESSKQLAAGFMTLGDMGYKKLSRYYSELLSEGNNCQSGAARLKLQGVANGHMPDADNVGMVIVRDIVSKTVIAQFRAHKSPILSLCFDPSGTLLVTASVQGHNINVFRILPGLSGGSSRSAESSYVHLYRLQRGFTNAVIQDISFSMDSQWIMISSSRGTSHLFSISPSGNCAVPSDSCLSARNTGSSLMTMPVVHGSQISGLQVLTPQSFCVSGSPITLSAVSRIRNGNNGWRSTVSGAAAAATGRVSSLSGTIASAFHNCKGNDTCTDASSMKKCYYLLVFAPSGSMIQYALQLSPAFSGMTTLPGSNVTCESGLDCDARLLIDAIQKWNICQKQNRKDREDNFDLYGENGHSSSSKVYPERMRQENSVLSNVTSRFATEERNPHHIYISEAELQMHQSQNPLWGRSEINFQSILTNGFNVDEESSSGGEIELENFPIRVIEARSKNLVPVFDFLQAPKIRHGRIPLMNSVNNVHLHYQGLEASEDVKLSCSQGSCSLEPMPNGRHFVNQSNNDDVEAWPFGLHLITDSSRGFVNTNNSPVANTQLDTVNMKENSVKSSQEHDEFD